MLSRIRVFRTPCSVGAPTTSRQTGQSRSKIPNNLYSTKPFKTNLLVISSNQTPPPLCVFFSFYHNIQSHWSNTSPYSFNIPCAVPSLSIRLGMGPNRQASVFIFRQFCPICLDASYKCNVGVLYDGHYSQSKLWHHSPSSETNIL